MVSVDFERYILFYSLMSESIFALIVANCNEAAAIDGSKNYQVIFG